MPNLAAPVILWVAIAAVVAVGLLVAVTQVIVENWRSK